ncbi:MAG: hypothetical protein HUU21_10075 [Polyangiaceae bacterium]|nr:hypothetical protein [Polyangiaceae bacterium]
MDLKTLQNVGGKSMNGKVGGKDVTLDPGAAYTFDSVCQMVEFINQNPDAGPVEEVTSEVIDLINKAAAKEGCAERIGGAGVGSATAGPGTASVPPDGDSPEGQGAPKVQPGSRVDLQFGPYGEPGDPRQPTEAMHDGRNPSSEGEIYDGELGRGATPEEAGEAAKRARKGEPPPGESRATHAGELTTRRSQGGDPVDLFSGLLVISVVDLDVPTPFIPIQFSRVYRSGRPYFGPWGYNWDHCWNVYLRELKNGNVARWNGRLHEDEFAWSGAAFEPPRGVFERLTRLSGLEEGYIIEAPQGMVLAFKRPPGWTDAERIPLVRISDRFGNLVHLSYGNENELTSVLDDDGRGLFFHYGKCALLEAVEDHAGRRVEYIHDEEAEHLVGVRFPATVDFPEGVVTQYEYYASAPHLAMRHNVLRVIDHDGNTIVHNFYGEDPSQLSFNRVVGQIQGGYVYEFAYSQIQYVPRDPVFVNTHAWQTSVRYPDGSLWTHTFNFRADLLDERYRLNLDGSFRVVVSQREYDAQGNVTRLIHSDGSTDEYTFDHTNADPRMRGNLLKMERRAPTEFPVQSRVVFQGDYDPVFQLPRHTMNEKGTVTKRVYDFDVSPGPSSRGALVRIEWPAATLPDGSVQAATTTFEVNARGLTTAVISPEGTRDELDPEPSGTTTAGFLRELRADALGVCAKTSFEYDTCGFLFKRTAPGESITELAYDALGRLRSTKLPEVDGVIDELSYIYNAHGALVRTLRPRGSYDDGVLNESSIADEAVVNPLGHVLEIVFGVNTAQPRAFCFTPDFQGRPLVGVDAQGVVTRCMYDERGLVLAETVAEGTPDEVTTRCFFDLAGKLQKVKAGGDRNTEIDYDPWGRPASVTLPNGSVVKTTWGPLDLPLSNEVIGSPGDGSPARLLRRVTYEHDERGRLVRRTLHSFTADPASATPVAEERWHDCDGRCTKRIGPLGAVWTYEYDGQGRLWREVDPLGNEIKTTFGDDGLPETVTSIELGPFGELTRVTKYGNDARGRLECVTTSSGAEIRVVHDARDLPIEQTNEAGIKTRSTFGLLGERLKEIIDPGGLEIVHEHVYDSIGRAIKYRDPTKEESTIDRDALGRITSITLAGGGVYRWFYNAAGEIDRAESADGSRIDYARDVVAGTVEVTATPGPGRAPVAVHTLTEDGLGRVVRAQAGSDVAIQRFDSLDRVVEEGFAERTFFRAHDDVAGCYTLHFPDGREEKYEWDVLGRVREVTLVSVGNSALGPASGAPGTTLVKLEYLGADRVARMVFANGAVSEWIHDTSGRLLRVEHTGPGALSLESARYRYDAANRQRVLQRTGAPVESHVFDFDDLDRLAKWRTGFALPALGDLTLQNQQDADVVAAELAAAAATHVELYPLDAADMRTVVTTTDMGVTTSVTYAQLPGHKVVQVGADAIGYDADGRRTNDSARVMTYDALGRVVKIAAAGSGETLAVHTYDPLGRWAGGELSGTAFSRFYVGELCVHEEDAGGAVTCQRTHIPALLSPSIETRTSGSFALHLDGHENLVLVTDPIGAPAERYRYSAFGEPGIFDGAGSAELGASALGLRPCFGGMPYLASAGLYFTRARHYDPQTGLFLARDPFLHVVSPSPYTYARHDPVNGLDPDGAVAPLVVAGLIVGGIGAVVGMASVAIRGGDYDWKDVVAAGGIGFGAGFIGAVTFGSVSSGLGGLLALGAGGAGTATTSVSINVISGAIAGGFSGFLSGAAAGAAGGAYRYGRQGGDLGSMMAEGTSQEAVAGAAGGAVGGALFGGLMRAGTVPTGGWRALYGNNPAHRAAILPSVIARGLLSPYGVGAAGIGFASAYSGDVTRRRMQGEPWETALPNATGEGAIGALTGFGAAALHPTSWQYWRIRLDPRAARHVRNNAAREVHHQRNVAQYPELATLRSNNQDTFFEKANRVFIGGNIQGPFSEYGAPGAMTHNKMHGLWRFGQRGPASNWSSHGPWTPIWNVSNVRVDPRASNHTDKP